jgi:hypothetical protein
MNNPLGITNLTEAGVAVAKLLKSYTAAAADGTVSIFEWVKIGIGNAGDILAAIQDASHIFPEVLDLKPYEFEEFYFAVLAEMGLEDDASGIARRRIGAVYDLVKQALTTAQQWSDETSGFDVEAPILIPRAVVPPEGTYTTPENYLDAPKP